MIQKPLTKDYKTEMQWYAAICNNVPLLISMYVYIDPQKNFENTLKVLVFCLLVNQDGVILSSTTYIWYSLT